jgi:hypothetical protein
MGDGGSALGVIFAPILNSDELSARSISVAAQLCV